MYVQVKQKGRGRGNFPKNILKFILLKITLPSLKFEPPKLRKIRSLRWIFLMDASNLVSSFNFILSRHADLNEILNSPDTILLYPTANAIDLKLLPKVNEDSPFRYTLVIIDGTWPQAKTMFNKSTALHSLKQVQPIRNFPAHTF